MINPRTQPWILVDMAHCRIRIPKHTLRCLGNPGFIRLLINPETRTLAVEVCDQSEPRRHRVPKYVMNSKQSFEIYSASLCDQLRMHTSWGEHNAYKLFAAAQAGEQLLIYNYDEACLSVGGMLVSDSAKKGTVNEYQTDT